MEIPSPKIYLAPFQGITGATFRTIYTNHFGGVDKLFTPFFTSIQHDNKLTPRRLAELGPPQVNSIQVVPQILSKDADEIIRFSNFCKTLGFSEINWNLGCPYPQVANKKRGSGMLPYPEMVKSILSEVICKTEIDFSIKCRLGYFSNQEITELIPVFNAFNISELIIHARIGRQLYSGEPDQSFFGQIAGSFSMPVVYNGDIFTPEDQKIAQTKFSGIHTLMIGRGLLYDPFLPSDIKRFPLSDNRKTLINRFINDLYFAYRKQMKDNLSVLSVLKEYWSYLSHSFNEPHKVFKKLKKVQSFDEYEEAVLFIFNEYDWAGSGNIVAKPY